MGEHDACRDDPTPVAAILDENECVTIQIGPVPAGEAQRIFDAMRDPDFVGPLRQAVLERVDAAIKRRRAGTN